MLIADALFSAVCQLWQANIAALAASDTSVKQTHPNLSSSCQQPSCCPAGRSQYQTDLGALHQQQQQQQGKAAAGEVGSSTEAAWGAEEG